MIPTVGFNMRKITKGNVTIKVRAEGCRGPRVFGRATEAPGKSQPGEGRVASCCWEVGRREPKTGKLGDWARRKPGGRKRGVPHRVAGTEERKLGSRNCFQLSPCS